MRPLRPLALWWTAFGVIPWIAVEARAATVSTVAVWVPAIAALLAVAWLVKDRTPVARPRLFSGAASAVFLLGLVRWAVLPSMAGEVGELGAAAAEARLSDLTVALRVVRVAFALAAGALLWLCVQALRRRRPTGT